MAAETEYRGAHPEFEELYRRWEREHWSAADIDFRVDAEHWNEKLTEIQRRSALWNCAMFLTGVEAEMRTLSVMLVTLRGVPERSFLATQVVDEARHRFFLDRFLREVAGQGSDPETTMEAAHSNLTWGFKQIFGKLEEISDQLRNKPSDRQLLTKMVALCHIVIEGVLAIPGEHFMARYLEKSKVMPGLAVGLANTVKDEARHVAFGTQLLRELLTGSERNRDAAIEVWDDVLPAMVGVFLPPGLDRSYVECFDFTLEDVYAFGLRTFEHKMEEVGIDPASLYLIARDDRSRSFEERGKRMLVLIEAGVMGDDTREPDITPEAFEILFEAMARATDVEVARALEGPVEWSFTDAEPWHIKVEDGAVVARRGRPERASLKLETASADWAKIAIGRTDPRWALLRRKLRVYGSFSSKAKLSRLFK